MGRQFDKEVKRQAFHLGLGVVLAATTSFLGYANSLYLLSAVLLVGLVFMAKTNKGRLEKFIKVFGREHETNAQGAFYFFVGAFLTVFAFADKAVPALLVLGVSDAAATLFGKRFKTSFLFGEKTLAGSLAFLITAFLVLVNFTTPLASFVVASTTMLVELLGFGVDDNVTIPFTAGFLLFII